jgi:hypothetical protein
VEFPVAPRVKLGHILAARNCGLVTSEPRQGRKAATVREFLWVFCGAYTPQAKDKRAGISNASPL